MIKMIVTDVDGTIVGKDEVLHDEMISYVKLLKKKGIIYTIATGRAAGLVEQYVKRLEIETPYIACNGGTLMERGEVLLRKTIPLRGLRSVFETADAMGMSLLYSIEGVETAYKETPYVRDQQMQYGRYLSTAVFTEEAWETLHVDKVIVMAAVRDGSIGEIEALCKALPAPFGYKRYANKAIDILHQESTKENGVRELADRMNIGMDEILFVGDDLNDVEVIKAVGTGVAVHNAQPVVKEHADYITEQDCYLGVMEAVDRFTGAGCFKAAMDNSLRRQSYDLPHLMDRLFDDLKEQIVRLFQQGELTAIRQVILTGCGDSYAAGLTLQFELEKLMGLPVFLATVIDFSRYYSKERVTGETLVVVVSSSGEGMRIREAVWKSRECGAITLAVTKQPDSYIGRRADKVLELSVPAFERGPGNRTYFASLLALLMLGIHMGQERGVCSKEQRAQYEYAVRQQGEVLRTILPQIDDPLFQLAKAWKSKLAFDFIGSGMEYGSAWFGHAKILEITGSFAMHINSEEWFHMNNFVRQIRECGTIFFVSKKAPGYSRTKEAVSYAKRLGRPVLVITDEEEDASGTDTLYVKVPSPNFTPAMALIQYVPVCILTGYMGAMLGEKNCRGCLGPWKFAAGGEFIRNSTYVEWEEYDWRQ